MGAFQQIDSLADTTHISTDRPDHYYHALLPPKQQGNERAHNAVTRCIRTAILNYHLHIIQYVSRQRGVDEAMRCSQEAHRAAYERHWTLKLYKSTPSLSSLSPQQMRHTSPSSKRESTSSSACCRGWLCNG